MPPRQVASSSIDRPGSTRRISGRPRRNIARQRATEKAIMSLKARVWRAASRSSRGMQKWTRSSSGR